MNGYETLDPKGAQALLQSGECLLFDVRTEPEFVAHRIAGARLLPIQDLRERHGEIPRDSERAILIVCEHGIRSVAACQALNAAGWRNIVNVSGGMAAWLEDGLPVERGAF